jgi:hypothetical protein
MARIRVAREQGRAVRQLSLAMERHGAATTVAVCAALAFQFPLSLVWQPSTYELKPRVAAPLAARTDTFFLLNYATNPLTRYIVFSAWGLGPDQYDPVVQVESIMGDAPYRMIFSDDGVYVLELSRVGRPHRTG